MGAEQSMPSTMGFETLWASLPDDVQASVAALASKESDVLLKPNPKAPGPLPPVPVGVTVRLDSEMARAALLIVPRLQRKHYETIPKQLDEMTFWVNFFSHMTVLVGPKHAEFLEARQGELSWKGKDEHEGSDSFAAVWAELSDSKKAEISKLAGKESNALLLPSLASPPAFPDVALGTANYIDETAAMSALRSVEGLQYKHYTLVPKKLDEKTFWVNFFTHMTALL